MHIEKIKSPADLRALDQEQLEELCLEIREFWLMRFREPGVI